VGPLKFKTLLEELASLLFNADKSLWSTFKNMLTVPGKSIIEYLRGSRKKYLAPFNYFAASLTIYWLVAWFFFRSREKEIGEGITMDLKILIILLFGMSFIAWLICGVKWGATRQRSYNFIEAVVVFCYIYGTNFLIAPVLVAFELQVWPQLTGIVGRNNMKVVTDLPLIALIAYMAYQFCKAAHISKLKYYLTLLTGFLYYYYMLDVIDNLLKSLQKYFS